MTERRNSNGYRMVMNPAHPLAMGSGYVLSHRASLYDALGDGPHPCWYGCGKMLDWAEIQIDHVDEDKLNNELCNTLPCCSSCHIKRHRPSFTTQALLTIENATVIRERLANGTRGEASRLAIEYGVSRQTISQIKRQLVYKGEGT